MNKLTLTNGLRFVVVGDLETAKSLWEQLATGSEIDDEWDFRYAFYRYLQFPLHFIAAYQGDEAVGLLPLQLNTGTGPIPESYPLKRNFLEFFGGDDTDSNQILVAPGYEAVVPALLEQIQGPAVLAPLDAPYVRGDLTAEVYTHRYMADLSKMSGFKDFLASHFDSKGRGKLSQQLARLSRDHEVEIRPAGAAELPLLFARNKERFGEASSFAWKYREDVFVDLMNRYEHDVFTVAIDGQSKAVSFALIYGKSYLGMNIGYDHQVRDLGKFVVAAQIQRAIARGCGLYDSGKGDGGWKSQFHLAKTPQYMLSIPGAGEATA